MQQLNRYRSKELCEAVLTDIHRLADRPMCFMEVCGGHTMAIRKYGIPSILPSHISLLSGPGCPVCVTSKLFVDQAIYLSGLPHTIVCTYGDMIRVHGSVSSLEKARAEGNNIRVVLSSLEALQIALKHPEKRIIFLGVGFETTAPATAAAMFRAKQQKILNFFVLSAHKLMPPAMDAIISEGISVDGYICPGHVSAITGTGIYENIVEKWKVGCVVSGFEPLDLLQTIYMLALQVVEKSPGVEIQYTRAVKPEGNRKALALMNDVFEPADDWWRGLGILKNSGLKPGKRYVDLDASRVFELPQYEAKDPPACLCGEVLKGIRQPHDCKLFGTACTPEDPVGACMVSPEGACQTHYYYDRD